MVRNTKGRFSQNEAHILSVFRSMCKILGFHSWNRFSHAVAHPWPETHLGLSIIWYISKVKVLNFQTPSALVVIILKFKWMSINGKMPQKDTDGIANREDPNLTTFGFTGMTLSFLTDWSWETLQTKLKGLVFLLLFKVDYRKYCWCPNRTMCSRSCLSENLGLLFEDINILIEDI